MKKVKQCQECGHPLKFIRYEFEKTNLIFGTTTKVYECTNCGAQFKLRKG